MHMEDSVEAGGIRVLVVDSEQALAQGLAEALVHQPGIAVAQAADSPDAAAAAIDGLAVDVVVTATDCEGWEPLAFIRDLDSRFPGLAVVAMSGDDDSTQVTAAIVAGAVSWVPKQVTLDKLASVVVSAARGEAWLPPAVLLRVLRRLAANQNGSQPESRLDRLTARERQILRYTARGLSRREIAARLEVSVNTVRSHSQHTLTKLGVHSTLEAVALALREEAIDDERPRP
jgi:DNA-binding NarL/FixJ family response regulator